jgi:CDP-6-deoxy-D-xylo-4-hexulose-3-dehydrase
VANTLAPDERRASTLKAIRDLVEQHFDQPSQGFVPGKTRIPLSAPTFGAPEVVEAMESLLSGYVTMGRKCRQFEEMVERDLGVKTALFANSGSSTNLLAVAALASPTVKGHWQRGDEIITPAVTWSTTVWPLIQYGLKPVFVDVDPKTLTLDLDKVEAAITPKTKGIALVHLLGNPVDMTRIRAIAQAHKLAVFEDCCEALGAKWKGTPVGTIGDAGSFSTYFSHHITTIEGGLMTTDREDVAEAARGLREHGWTRSLKSRKEWAAKHPDIDDRFLFYHTGYNLRPTEVNAAFGLHQWPRLPEFLKTRAENHAFWMRRMEPYREWIHLVDAPPGATHFSFAASPRREAPFSRAEWSRHLESKGIETRPIMTGNFLRHPAWKTIPADVRGGLDVADFVSDQGLLWGNHHLIGKAEREYVADVVDEFMAAHGA